MHPPQLAVHGKHFLFYLFRHRIHLFLIVAQNMYLHRIGNRLIIQLANADMGFREMVGIGFVQQGQQFFRGFHGAGVDDQLGQIFGRHTRCISNMKTRCGFADKGSYSGNSLIYDVISLSENIETLFFNKNSLLFSSSGIYWFGLIQNSPMVIFHLIPFVF